jgi:hypothetical protein
LIVDLSLPVHPDPTIDFTLIHLLNVSVFGSGLTISLGYNGSPIGSVSIPATGFTRNSVHRIACTGDFFDSVGVITIGDLDDTLKFSGSFTFNVNGGRLEATVLRPEVRGVSSLYVQNGTDISGPFQNDIILQAGRNFLINVIAGIGAEPDRIVFNAIDGTSLDQGCECSEGDDRPCVKTINGIPPDNDGNFQLDGDDCIQLDAISNGLKIVESCATPCCGCDELNIVKTTLESIVQQITSLESLASRIDSAISNLSVNVLKK